jgi:hypothetical protein
MGSARLSGCAAGQHICGNTYMHAVEQNVKNFPHQCSSDYAQRANSNAAAKASTPDSRLAPIAEALLPRAIVIAGHACCIAARSYLCGKANTAAKAFASVAATAGSLACPHVISSPTLDDLKMHNRAK